MKLNAKLKLKKGKKKLVGKGRNLMDSWFKKLNALAKKVDLMGGAKKVMGDLDFKPQAKAKKEAKPITKPEKTPLDALACTRLTQNLRSSKKRSEKEKECLKEEPDMMGEC